MNMSLLDYNYHFKDGSGFNTSRVLKLKWMYLYFPSLSLQTETEPSVYKKTSLDTLQNLK